MPRGEARTESPPSCSEPWASPVFRWAGSKRKLIPILMANTPSHYNRYFEPFAGSACLLFALKPASGVLNDINQDLVDSYDLIRRHPRLLARELHALPRTKREYYRQRSLDTTKIDEFQRAVRFVYLNRYCFNGVYRTNRDGRFNVPRGKRTGKIPEESKFYRCAVGLRNVELRSLDFEACLKDVKRGDFVYLDPPYSTTDRARYGEYGYASFQPIDVPRLVETLKHLDIVGAKFLLSYAGGSYTQDAFSQWHCKTIQVRRHVAGFVDHRTSVCELIVSNYEAE